MRTSGVYLVLFTVFVCTFVNGAQFYVRDGSSCHGVSLGECFSCSEGGITYSEQCNDFEDGRVGCGRYSGNGTTGCNYQETYRHTAFTPCAALPQCEVSPSSFVIFSVQHNNNLSVLVVPESVGYVTMDATQATAVGTLTTMIFRNEATGDLLRFIDQFDDGSYLTNVGLCDFGTSCTLGGFVFTATQYSSEAALTEREAAVAATVMTAGGAVTPVSIEVGESYGFSVSAETDIFLYEYGVVVNEEDLANIAVSVPPHIAITDMTLKNADQKYPSLVCKLSFRDFETYTEAECYHSELSDPNETEGVECEFSFSLSFDLSELFSNFFFSLSLSLDEEEPAEWEEQSSFTLFE